MKSWDKDGDGRLSRSEVATMVDAAFVFSPHLPDGRLRPDAEKQRQEMLGFYASQDTNPDGYLTLNELLKLPLASFDCADENHDGKLSEEEEKSSFYRCPHIDVIQYAPKP
ncbi:MAG TPA: hypothetical protein VHU90_07180 [Galbitalea sp.]|nr:hypothetical protein [Galbitalea sp.]